MGSVILAYRMIYTSDYIEKQKLATKGKTKPNKTKGIKRGPRNKVLWLVIYPDTTEQVITNLTKFCVQHNLLTSSMWKVAEKRRAHHKQFKCSKVINTK